MIIARNVIETLGDSDWVRFGENMEEIIESVDDQNEYVREHRGLAFNEDGSPKSIWVVYND